MSKSRASLVNLLSRCFQAPYRALCHARDLYIRGMTACAGHLHYVGELEPLSLPSNTPANMSRTTSVSSRQFSSGDDDLIEVILAAASHKRTRLAAPLDGFVPRSRSLAAVRIDENTPYNISGDEVKVGGSLIFPRSWSHAVGGGGYRVGRPNVEQASK